MPLIRISAERSYDVLIGSQWRSDLLLYTNGRSRIAVISSESNRDLIGDLPALDGEVLHIEIPDGENGKTQEVLSDVIDKLGAAGFTRSDVIVGIGGGTVTDLTGFAAATWLRGIDWIAIPTTVAGAVDASIGGKTGVNTRHGKNLFGAFHSPIAVLVDFSWFDSISDRDFSAGLAEVIKCGFIADTSILDLVEGKNLAQIRSNAVLVEYLVLKAIRVKAEVVSKDFKESELREILNYGHTVGHALEKASQYSLRHGECVAIGMVYAAELARDLGLVGDDMVSKHREILSSLGLPVSTDRYAWGDIEQYLSSDKKARGHTLRFVLLEDLARPIRVSAPESTKLAEIYEKVAR